jgi:hypothetical protein
MILCFIDNIFFIGCPFTLFNGWVEMIKPSFSTLFTNTTWELKKERKRERERRSKDKERGEKERDKKEDLLVERWRTI